MKNSVKRTIFICSKMRSSPCAKVESVWWSKRETAASGRAVARLRTALRYPPSVLPRISHSGGEIGKLDDTVECG